MGSDVFSWRKSSLSGEAGQCVELGTAWQQADADIGAVRDSKNPAGPMLRVDLGSLIAFAKGH
jgi:hypothetical protein